MLAIDRLRRDFWAVPTLVRLGLAGMVFAGFADVIAHLEMASHAGHLHDHGSTELSAHLAGFVGMCVVFVGVVADGVRQARDRR